MNIPKLQGARLSIQRLSMIFLCLFYLPLVSCSSTSVQSQQENKIVSADRYHVRLTQVPRCGTRIEEADIRVIHLEDLDYDAERLEREIGPFTQVTEMPVAVSSKGTEREVEQRVRKTAAEKGCDLVLLGPVVTETVIWGGDGINGSGSGGKKEEPFQLFRMGFTPD